ncbi:MAG: hypothetical protein ACRDYU_09340 [Actinomycetes bacterium]
MVTRALARSAFVVLSAATVAVGGSSAAWAFDCFTPKRSSQGAESAARSGNWAPVPRAELLAEIEGDLTGLGATPEQVACFTEEATSVLPETLAIGTGPAKGQGFVIASNNPQAKVLADGRGIDHLEPVLIGIAADCGIAVP